MKVPPKIEEKEVITEYLPKVSEGPFVRPDVSQPLGALCLGARPTPHLGPCSGG